jgi:hypothetical protein
MAEIYKALSADDIVAGDIQTVSQPLWSENINPLSGGYAAGVGFFTSSAQISQSGNYYANVYHRATTDVNSQIQFAVAYGHRLGSGSEGDPNTTGQNTNDTPSRAIYSQYRNQLLPPTDQAFTFGGITPNDILVINVSRNRFRQKIDPGNWELRLASGSATATAYSSFIDGSGAGEDPLVNQGGRIFPIYSGSGGVTASGTVYGLFYPDNGVFIFNATALSASLGMAIDKQSPTVLTSQPRNHLQLYSHISSSNYFAARTEEKINSTHYFVRVTNKQFNFSNNPTFITGSQGVFRHSSMLRNPSVYITTIGLYDNGNRLVAVAKLSKPLLKSFNREALIKVKLDY